MTTAPDLTIDDALETLVNQFADPMAFFRELIQNSLDAGSPEIDVSVSHDGDMLTVHVQDYGEGMDRNIIDTRLTRLFSSSKDGDFTKIGRFGIGFVSVFAIRPEAVCVDTARGGEAWRVLFKEDRTFERIRLETPVEGTLIRVFKRMPAEEAQTFRQRAREVVTFWCKHAAAEVRVDGEPINQGFDVAGMSRVSHEEQGTRVVAAYVDEPAGFYGFYNRGLTLLEGPPPATFHPHVGFKIDSRYLEHTLTRDNVLRDTQFDKAMAIVERLVTKDLPARLFAELGASDTEIDAEARERRFAALAALLGTPERAEAVLERFAEMPIFRAPSGAALTLGTVRQAARRGELTYEPRASPVTERLEARGAVVVVSRTRSAVHQVLKVLAGGQAPPRAGRVHATALPLDASADADWQALTGAVHALLDAYGAKVRTVGMGRLSYPGSSVSDRVVITQRELGELTPTEEAQSLATSFFARARVVVINADHPTVKDLGALAPREPELAAYLTVKLFFLHGELTPEIDGALAARAVERRCVRLGI